MLDLYLLKNEILIGNPSTIQLFNLSTYQPINLSTYQPINLSFIHPKNKVTCQFGSINL